MPPLGGGPGGRAVRARDSKDSELRRTAGGAVLKGAHRSGVEAAFMMEKGWSDERKERHGVHVFVQ